MNQNERNENGTKHKSSFVKFMRFLAIFLAVRAVLEAIKQLIIEKTTAQEEKTKFADTPEHYAVLNGRSYQETEEYKGGEYTAVLGGIELDLSKANIKEDISIVCKTALGGIEVRVPNDVNVVLSGTVILGGVANMVPEKRSGATIYMYAEGVMGGICVRAAEVQESKDDPAYGGADISEDDFVEEEQA